MFLRLDTEDPTIISCPENQTKYTASNLSTAEAVWTEPQVNDNSGLPSTISCSFESGSQFKIGQTEVTCEARDANGNEAFCAFTVEVIGKYDFRAI